MDLKCLVPYAMGVAPRAYGNEVIHLPHEIRSNGLELPRAIRHGRGAQRVWLEVIHLPHEIRSNGLEMCRAIRHGRGAQRVWHEVIHLPHEIRANGVEMLRAIRHGRGPQGLWHEVIHLPHQIFCGAEGALDTHTSAMVMKECSNNAFCFCNIGFGAPPLWSSFDVSGRRFVHCSLQEYICCK